MSASCMAQPSRRQSGSALIVSMILLVILTLIVISVIKSTTVNSRVAGNLQVQKETDAAAQQAVEAVITSNFQNVPVATTAAVSVSNAASSSAVGQYTVSVQKPTCLSVAPIKVVDLNPADTGDQPCYTSSSNPMPGVAGGNSLCSNSQWDITATAAPTAGGGAQVVMHQGIAVRVAAASTCPP
jgi:cytoskeletal protein RodZ